LSWFAGIVVSGEERVTKPDPKIFNLLLRRYHVLAPTAVFVDAARANAVAAARLGLLGIHFQSPRQLRADFEELGLL
jgi:2-haloacid dehalogenase